MIRILHIVSSINQDSGVMNFLMNYYRDLDKTKYQFDFLFWEEDQRKSFSDEIIEYGGNLYKISKPKISKKSYNELNYNISLYLKKNHIVHLHELYLNLIVKKILKNKASQLISHAHTTKYSDKFINSIRNKILCLNINKISDYYFACSLEAGKFYFSRKFNIDFEKSNIIRNAINIDKYKYRHNFRTEKKNELGISDKVIFGHVGRFNNQKNHKFLIEVFFEIQKKVENAVLILVGEGPLEKDVKNQIDNLKIRNKVFLMGTRNDVNEIMQAIDVFLLPSHYEGLGIVLIEAQVAGVPCITSSVVPKEVSISNSIFFEKIDSVYSKNNWAEKAINLANEFSDKRNIINQDHDYNIKKEVKKLERIYLRIQEKSRR